MNGVDESKVDESNLTRQGDLVTLQTMARSHVVVALLAVILCVSLIASLAEAHPGSGTVESLAIPATSPSPEVTLPAPHVVEPFQAAAEPLDAGLRFAAWEASPPPASAIPILLILAAAVAVGSRRSRAVAVMLGLALSIFAVQSAIHSVHHIGHPHEAEHCLVLSVSQHAPGDVPTGPPVNCPVENVAEFLPAPPVSLASDPALRPEQGRAPPAQFA